MSFVNPFLRAVNTLVSGIYVLVYATGLRTFRLWPQVISTDEMRLPYSFTLLFSNPHALRYYLVRPFFELSRATGIDADRFYSPVAAVLIVLTAYFVRAASRRATGRPVPAFAALCITLALLSISLAMNGRINFSFCGYAMIVAVAADGRSLFSSLRRGLVAAMGLVMCSVSSGTFIVMAGFIALNELRILLPQLLEFLVRRISLRVAPFFVAALLILLFSPITIVFFSKNVRYYGEGLSAVWAMLDHGAGALVKSADPALLVVGGVLAMSAGLVYLVLVLLRPDARIPLIAAGAASLGGLFGYSTLTLSIPSALATFLVLLLPARHRRSPREERVVRRRRRCLSRHELDSG